jgi:beta-lactamase class A
MSLSLRRGLATLTLSLLGSCEPVAPTAAPVCPVAALPPPPSPPASVAPRAEKLSIEDAIKRMLTAPTLREDWFAPAFLAAIPFAQVQPVRDGVLGPLGSLVKVTGKGTHFSAVYEKGKVSITAELDAAGRFTTLFIKGTPATPPSMALALEPFKRLPGKVSLVVLDGSTTLGDLEPDLPLAVGSTFKLAALAALRGEIDRKKRGWRDVVTLSGRTRSLPSGILQDWPEDAPVTLYTLAALMISKSDNTATDTLIDLVGRKNIEAAAGRNKPYLMTREVFLLKKTGNEAQLARWRAADEAGRRALLDEIKSSPLPRPADYPTNPTALDVEWFFSPRELCALMAKVEDLPLMTINPGVADKRAWTRVAYKGGSEPGVVSTTTWLEKGAHKYCVSATSNADTALDEAAFFAAEEGVFGYLAAQP